MKTVRIILRITLCLGLLLSAASCIFSDNRLQVQNDSEETISIAFIDRYREMIVNDYEFSLRDTIGAKHHKIFGEPSGINRDGWSIWIRDTKDEKLTLVVLNRDTLKKYKGIYPINQLMKNKLYDTILHYSESELDRIHWRVVYHGRHR